MNGSKCCHSRLIPIKEDFGAYGIRKSECRYCSNCGLMYHEVKRRLKPEEPDPWE